MACNRYIPSSTKNYRFGFLLKYKVVKWDVKADSTVIGPALLG
jgi:hypothetical protein